jgi:hypothetical protein
VGSPLRITEGIGLHLNRKERIREYKDSARPMGVFRVYNTATGKSFVGASNDLPAMLNRQRFQLELGSHPNRALQLDWNSRGPEAFVFEVLDTLDPPDDATHDSSDDLRVLEEMWLERLSPYAERGYHRPPGGAA